MISYIYRKSVVCVLIFSIHSSFLTCRIHSFAVKTVEIALAVNHKLHEATAIAISMINWEVL